MKRIVFILMSVILSQFANAQSSRDRDRVYLQVAGLVENEIYTREEIIKLLGEPDTLYYADMSDYLVFSYNEPGDFFSTNQSFGFRELRNGTCRFEQIHISSSRYEINKGIKVGSHVAELFNLPGFFRHDKEHRKINWYGGANSIDGESWAYTFYFIYNEDGIIEYISTDYLP